MKKNPIAEVSRFVQGEEGYLFIGPTEAQTALENALRAIEGALLCIGEGNIEGAAGLLYAALPKARRPTR